MSDTTVIVNAPGPPDLAALPDHPIRNALWYQLLNRLWRPVTAWLVCPVAGAYALIIAPAVGRPLAEGYLALLLTFSAAIYGLNTIEKFKGVR